jgi:hypothetical protein
MKYYKTHNYIAVFSVIAFVAFLGAVIFWPQPQAVSAVSVSQAVARQTSDDDSHMVVANLVQSQDIADPMDSQVDNAELLSVDNTADESTIIQISSSDSESSTRLNTESFTQSDSGSSSSQGPVPAGGGGGSGSSGSSSSGSSGAGGSGSSGSGSSGGGGGGGTVQPDYSLPDWIQKEGIRAGFMSSTYGLSRSISSFVEVAKDIGLNTAIVYGCSFAEAPMHLKSYREWLRRCNQAGLHVFAFYGWQPPVGNTCRPVVFADGTEGLFPCPLDNKLWQNYFRADMADKLAKLSVEGPHYQFDGFFLDMEMYRTEDQPEAKRNYSFDTCFCDFCFSTFILNRTPIKDLPLVSKDRRKLWLSQNNYLTGYYVYLTEQVEARAQELKTAVHAINPKLLFGVYPAITDENWVLTAVLRAFGRDSYPVISFTTETYGYFGNRAIPSTWGAARIPADVPAYFEKYNINGVYAAGYLFRAYTSSEMREHLVKSCQKAQGYWLFRMPQLLEDNIPESEALAVGTQAEYLQAIKNANAVLGTR